MTAVQKVELAKRLKLFRKDNDLTQGELAVKLQVSTPTVNKYETGELTPSLNVAAKYADIFEKSLDEVYGRIPAK